MFSNDAQLLPNMNNYLYFLGLSIVVINLSLILNLYQYIYSSIIHIKITSREKCVKLLVVNYYRHLLS
jgi:hypothetical protein